MTSTRTPGDWTAVHDGKKWSVRAARSKTKYDSRPFSSIVSAVGGDKENHEANARVLAAAVRSHEALKTLVAAVFAMDDVSDQAVNAAREAKEVLEEVDRRASTSGS